MLESVRNRFAWRAAEQDRSIEIDARGGLELSGDRLRLEQALGNLVDNALRHGGGTVHLSASTTGSQVELLVRDDGPGFPDGFIARAFDRFSTTETGRSGGGTGLGLSIVDAIARAHGGSVTGANRAGIGAEVRLSVPASVAEASPTSSFSS